MSNIQDYAKFCNKFRAYKLPKLSFKDVNDTYKILYREYGVEKSTIDKATFFIFIVLFPGILISTILLIKIQILVNLTCSFFISIIISYYFNVYLYKKINKEEAAINASIYFIKINFSLLQKVLIEKSDLCINFIKLMKSLELPLSAIFKEILNRIQQGKSPEKELMKVLTSSDDFNKYLQKLLISNFKTYESQDSVRDNSIEKQFKTFLKSLEGRLAIIFFIGIFFPIGLIFVVLFLQVNFFVLFLVVPAFLFLLNFVRHKVGKVNIFFIGILKGTKAEKRLFEQFLSYLEGFAIKLQSNLSPEKAFITHFLEKEKQLVFLHTSVGTHTSNLIKLSCSFNEMIDSLKMSLKNLRYKLILDTIKIMISESAYLSSEKIFEILNIIDQHRKLEDKFETELKSQKFKVLAFSILLPIITGAISGMMPFFTMFSASIGSLYSVSLPEYLSFSMVNILSISSLFITMILCNSVACYHFLKVVKYKSYQMIIGISDIIFILAFFTSFMMVINFF